MPDINPCEEKDTKDARIKKEKARLAKIFKKLDENAKKIAEKLIDRAAFMLIALEDMEQAIKAEGPITKMSQGQYVIDRAHPLLSQYNAMAKIFAAICKQLYDLLPEPVASDTEEGKRLLEFVAGRRTP
jgi:hypothetical protein